MRIEDLITEVMVGLGGDRSPRNRGTPGYPVPADMRATDPSREFEDTLEEGNVVPSEPMDTRIPHLEDLAPGKFYDFMRALAIGRARVTEKIDGAARITFGIQDGMLWTQSKNGPRKFALSEYPDEPRYAALRAAHAYLDEIDAKDLLPEGCALSGDILHTEVPNSITYGQEGIVVHGTKGITHEHFHAFLCGAGLAEHEWAIWKVPEVRVRELIEGWFEANELGVLQDSLKEPEKFRKVSHLVKERFVHDLRARTSAFGPDIEGLVVENIDTGELCKIVDRKFFTELNRFNWSWREMLDKGTGTKGNWTPGIMQEFRNRFADEIMHAPVAKTPGFVPYLLRYSKKLDEGIDARSLLEQYIVRERLFPGDAFYADFRRLHRETVTRFASLTAGWVRHRTENPTFKFMDESGRVLKERKMHPLIVERTNQAIKQLARDLDEMDKRTRASWGSPIDMKVALLSIAMGHRYDRLVEGLGSSRPALLESPGVSTVGVTVGRFQPFHAGHAKLIRELAGEFSRVIVFMAGQKPDPKSNPFSPELRRKMMEYSLPDAMAKVEIVPARNGHIPDLLQDLVTRGMLDPSSPVTLRVGPDRVSSYNEQMRRNETSKIYPGRVLVQQMPEMADAEGRLSGTRLRELLARDQKDAIRSVMDPHLTSDDLKFDEVYNRMRAEAAQTMVEKIFEWVLQEIGSANFTGYGGQTFGKGWGSSGWSRAVLAKDENDAEWADRMEDRIPSGHMVKFQKGQPNSNLPGVNSLDLDDEEDSITRPTDLDDQ